MAEVYSGSTSIDTTEISLVSGTSTLQSVATEGVYQVWIDVSALTDTEVYELSIKEKTRSGDTQRVARYFQIAYSQPTTPLYVTEPLLMMHGWDVTMKKLSGTARTITWSIRKV